MSKWTKVRLGNYIQEYSERNKDNAEFPVYSVTNSNGFCTEYFSKEVASKDKTTYKIVKKGYFAYNPSRINVGSVDWLKEKETVIVSPLYNVFSVTNGLYQQYLYYYLKSPVGLYYIKELATGSVRDNLKFSILADFSIPLPPIEIQKQISDILDKVTHLIDLCNVILEKLDLLVKARFVEMFGDIEVGTCIFPIQQLKNLSVKISDGVHAKPEYTQTGRPFLSVVNINKKKIDFTDCKFVSEEAYQKMIKSTHPEKGDVLYTKVGATYGIPAYIDTDTSFCLYVSVCLIKPRHDLINSKFLAVQMDMPFIKHQADRRIKGIGVPDLHLNQISEFDIICPPRFLQDNFIEFVEQTDKSKLVVKEVLEKAEILKKALMQKYFE